MMVNLPKNCVRMLCKEKWRNLKANLKAVPKQVMEWEVEWEWEVVEWEVEVECHSSPLFVILRLDYPLHHYCLTEGTRLLKGAIGLWLLPWVFPPFYKRIDHIESPLPTCSWYEKPWAYYKTTFTLQGMFFFFQVHSTSCPKKIKPNISLNLI